MKSSFPRDMERARLTEGAMASAHGDPFGVFFLLKPVTKIRLKIIISDGMGWDHVSVSRGWQGSRRKEVPSWGDMCWINGLIFKPDECVVQYHPPEKDYVNIHPGVLHLWRPQKKDILLPPRMCV